MNRTSVVLLISCMLFQTTFVVKAEPPTSHYLQKIKPVLQSRCWACHGALKKESGLRLDTGASIRDGGDSGPAIDVQDPDLSLLLQRVEATELTERMPPEGEPLTPNEISAIRDWIASGGQSPANERAEVDPHQHWAFLPPVRSPLPPRTSGRHPVDRLITLKLQEYGLKMQPFASPNTQLRRLYLDLIGIPPTAADLQTFLGDKSPDAYEKVVDQLLASPLYGQRWGRHWMDVWRYSDWYGRRMVPDVWNSAPQIWRWRDWIVDSLNADKGYDQMISEMLAGDEIDPTDVTASHATGYLVRNWYALNPNDWMRSNVEYTGKAFLGLTFNCAHCHDHKYDPITQRDYFRFRAFFEPLGLRQDQVAGEPNPDAFQEYEYSVLRKIVRIGAIRVYDKHPDAATYIYLGGDERNRLPNTAPVRPGLPLFLDPTDALIQEVRLPVSAWYPGWQSEIRETNLKIAQQQLRVAEQALLEGESQNEPTRLNLRAQRDAAAARLASTQARLAADQAEHGDVTPKRKEPLAHRAAHLEFQSDLAQLRADVAQAAEQLAVAKALPDTEKDRDKRTTAAQTSWQKANEKLNSAVNSKPQDQANKYTRFSSRFPRTSTGRRRALAQWITSRRNPLTARVAVNHIWARHLHAPLVSTVFDFGRNGQPPTHPRLLDWLAVELQDTGWRMKQIHRKIVTSHAYRMQSLTPHMDETAVALDPDNRWLWRANVGRMEAEVVRDSLLSCANELDSTLGGQELENVDALTTHRRSLYYSCHPELDGKSEFGELFDAAEASECFRRTRSIVPQQALALTNSHFIHRISKRLSEQTWAELVACGRATPNAFVRSIFEQLLTRYPTPQELAVSLAYLKDNAATSDSTSLRASFTRAILNHNDFLAIR